MENEFTLNWDYKTFRRMTNDGKNPQVAVSRGEMAEQNNDLDGALEDYSNAIEYDPNYVDAYCHKARVLDLMHREDEAIQLYLQVLDKANNKDVVLCSIGIVYANKKEYNTAMEYLDKAVSFNPQNDRVMYYRGNLKYKCGNYESAFFDMTKAIEINPDNINAILTRGLIRVIMNDFSGAYNDFSTLIEKAKNKAEAYYLRGKLLVEKMGNIQNGKQDLIKAEELGSGYAKDYLKKIE